MDSPQPLINACVSRTLLVISVKSVRHARTRSITTAAAYTHGTTFFFFFFLETGEIWRRSRLRRHTNPIPYATINVLLKTTSCWRRVYRLCCNERHSDISDRSYSGRNVCHINPKRRFLGSFLNLKCVMFPPETTSRLYIHMSCTCIWVFLRLIYSEISRKKK